MPESLIIPVSLGGLAAGRELGGAGMLHFDGEMLRIDPDGAPAHDGASGRSGARRSQTPLRWPVAWLDGVRHRGEELTLYLRDGDIIEITGPARLAAVAGAIEQDARALGELTRGLRSLGARRRGTGAGGEQGRFFAPLMRARQAVERSSGHADADQLSAFDGDALRAALASSIAELARGRYPDSDPDRRALEAELEECAEHLMEGLAVVSRAADGVRRSGEDTRLVQWRQWSRAVRSLFERADRCWCAMAPILEHAPPAPPRPWWRRALRLGPAGRGR